MHTLAADRSWVEAEPALNCFRLKVFFLLSFNLFMCHGIMFHLRLRQITCCEKEYFDSLLHVFESVTVECPTLSVGTKVHI